MNASLMHRTGSAERLVSFLWRHSTGSAYALSSWDFVCVGGLVWFQVTALPAHAALQGTDDDTRLAHDETPGHTHTPLAAPEQSRWQASTQVRQRQHRQAHFALHLCTCATCARQTSGGRGACSPPGLPVRLCFRFMFRRDIAVRPNKPVRLSGETGGSWPLPKTDR